MSDAPGPAKLIDMLAHDLQPVRRLPSPMTRALLWLAVFGLAAAVLSFAVDMHAMRERLFAATHMWLSMLGSALTAALAAIAAFQTSVPGRGGARWAWLPVPAVLMWLGSSGLGCLQVWVLPGAHDPTMAEESHCFMEIAGYSIPLSLLMLAMLRRAYPLRPNLTAVLAGTSAAAAAATLLAFSHPFNPAATDVLAHAAAVALVIAANRALGGRILGRT